MSRKKQSSEAHEEHADETWLIPYSDLLTLLLALFIVLFASSSLDKAKINQMEYAFAAAFSVIPSNEAKGNVMNFINDAEKLDLGDDVFIGSDSGGAVIDIKNLLLFDDGKAIIKPEGSRMLKQIAALLETGKYRRYRVLIEGHTDDRPFQNETYPSNWELSSARAGAVVRELIKFGNTPTRFQAIGMAEVAPKHPNKNSYGEPIPVNRKLNNRLSVRVEI